MINKVFGIGLSKTGTSTLGEALNLLGIRTIHYPDDPVTLAELRSGNFRLSILNHFQAVVDTPVVSYYAQLDQVYPGSKFILTIRDMDSWLTSVQKHWETSATFTNQPLRKQFQEFIRTAVYGCIEFNRDRFQYVYNTHQQNVIQYFKDRPGDLLLLDICAGDSWEKLCSFLNLPVPELSFPHANEWMHKLIKASESLTLHVPLGSSMILIDDQAFGIDFANGRKIIPFHETHGIYTGPPAVGDAAIHELEKSIAHYHPDYLVIGWPSFWWKETYPSFLAFIRSRFPCMSENDELLIFQLSKAH